MTNAAIGIAQQRPMGLIKNADDDLSAENTLKATIRNQPLSFDADKSNQTLSQRPKKQTGGFIPGKKWFQSVMPYWHRSTLCHF